jgi:hypothetical protein
MVRNEASSIGSSAWSGGSSRLPSGADDTMTARYGARLALFPLGAPGARAQHPSVHGASRRTVVDRMIAAARPRARSRPIAPRRVAACARRDANVQRRRDDGEPG